MHTKTVQNYKKHIKTNEEDVQICKDIEEAPKGVVGVKSVKRELVFNPPFTMDMVPEDTKIIMGWA